MVFEGRIAEMLQNQASRFLRGFSGEQLRIGLLSGRLELCRLALNAEPLDSLLLESEIPLVMKAGVLMSAVTQISLLQGELELVIDGLILDLCPACRWLTKTEVFSHRLNEIQRLEFVHMRSQCQRRTLEREMFRQLFSDYLSRLKISVRNVHIRIEVEGEVDSTPRGRNLNACFGIVLGSCDITPVKGVVMPPDKDKDPSSSELLLAESVQVKGLSLYHEPSDRARLHVSWNSYFNTRNRPLGVFDDLKQEKFVALMDESRQQHAQVPVASQLMPAASFAIAIDLRSQPVRDGFHVDSCLTMEITVKLEAPSCLQFSTVVLGHLQWFVRRTLDFQLWQFLHPVRDPPERSTHRWNMLRAFVGLKRRIHSNNYALSEAITMRIHCKEYVRLYKKKFNGQNSVVQWRKNLPALTHNDAVKLSDIELVYPADKLVNFRLMAHAELKTEMALNSFLNSDDGQTGGQYRRAARELTPLEQLHLHGQHGYGVNIYRGLPPPPSSLKIRIDIQAPQGLWWTCRLNGMSSQPGQTKSNDFDSCWTVAADCAAQPIRLLLVDSIVDASVFATLEVPKAPRGQRPLAVLLGRTGTAFSGGSPGRSSGGASSSSGGKGPTEWCSIVELDGPVYLCSQLKTVLTSSPNSPWDIFAHFSCGDSLEISSNGVSPLDGFGSMPLPQRAHNGVAGTGADPDACVRIRVPLTLASGQAGPLVSFLKQSVASARSAGKQEVRHGPNHSLIAWLARRVGSTRDVAVFRLHLRVPPVLLEGSVGNGPSLWMPRFDGACHLEHGGLIDGFVVGLHHLRHFAASLMLATTVPTAADQSASRSTGSRASCTPWSLQPLEKAPPCTLLIGAMSAAFAVAMSSRPQGSKPGGAGGAQGDAAFVALLKKTELAGIIKADALSDPESPIAAVTLLLVVMAVMVSRRVLWNERDSRPGGPDSSGTSAETSSAAANAVGEIHSLAGSMMRALLLMGFPLHPHCLPLAAWNGALEVLEAASHSVPSGSPWPPPSLIIWAARGAYANLQARQDEVVRWLLRQHAQIDETDKGGRSLLDWACWGGAEGLASMGVRAGLLPVTARAGGFAPAESAASVQPASSSTSPPPPPTPPLPPPSPLTLAVAGRSQRVVAMLLRAAGDPHAPPRGGSCGPLLLAVRTCEYDLGCQVLKDAAFVSVDAALGPTLASSANGTQNGVVTAKGDYIGDPVSMAGCTVRATVALIDSLRRFAGSLSRRSAEDYASSMSAASLRSQLPGPHPDEGLYATGQMPFNDILHPLAVQLPLPLHKVGHEFRPHPPPHRWLRRGTVNPWSRAQRFIECCLKRDFRPDPAVVGRALPHLPPEARAIVQQLLGSGQVCTEVSMDSSPGSLAPWFGSVLGNSDGRMKGEAPFYGGTPTRTDFTPERTELSAAISFAKEIRELRSRGPGEGVPPLDIAAALGADGLPAEDAAQKANKGRRVAQSHRLQASPGPPTVWVTVSLGGSSPAAGPISLDALRIHGGSLTLKLREPSGRSVQGVHLQDIAAVRQFELSGFEGPEMKHIVEVRLRPDADAMPLVGDLLAASGEAPKTNGYAGHKGTHIVSLVFLRSEDAEQFAATLQSSSQQLEAGSIEDQDARVEDVARYLQGGPWDPVPELNACMLRTAESLRRAGGINGSVAPPPAQLPPNNEHSSLPRVRVVVLGAPRVGKTRAVTCILNDLAGVDAEGIPIEGDIGPGWMRASVGKWPTAGPAKAEVHVWDGSAAPLPGLLERLVADASAPLFLVCVVDASLSGLGAPAVVLAATCAAEASATSLSSVSPRRVLTVENAFPGAAIGSSALSRGGPGQHLLRCNLRDAQGCAELRRAFGSLMSELVAEVEARLRSLRGPLMAPLLNGKSNWSAVVATRPSVPVAQALPAMDLALSSHLRGDSALLDPSATGWAWAVIRASHGCLVEGCGVASCGGAVVPWDRLERVLAAADGESGGSEAAPVLLRALADLGLVCPIPSATTNAAENSACISCNWVLVPDFGRRIRLANAAALRTACGEAVVEGEMNGAGASSGKKSASMSARLMWDAPNSSPPSLRACLRNFLARAALGTPEQIFEVRRFVLLEAGPSSSSTSLVATDGLAPGFLLVFDLVTRVTAETDPHKGSAVTPVSKPPPSVREATPSGQPQSARTLASNSSVMHSDDDLALGTSVGFGNGSRLTAIIIGSSSGEAKKGSEKPFWDFHCAGPHAQWASRMFLGTGAAGPSFSGCRRLPSSATGSKARGTAGGSSSSTAAAWPLQQPPIVLSQVEEGADASAGPDFVHFAWLFSGRQANSSRVPVSSATPGEEDNPCSCCAALCLKNTEDQARRPEDSAAPRGTSKGGDFEVTFLEAAILARNWLEATRHLEEALTSGWEAYSSCATSMARMAHEFAATAGGSEARALPLLAEAGGGMGGTSRAVALVPEGPLPLAVGTRLRPPGVALGQIRSCAGVEAWLRLCRPVAIWSAAGASRGFSAAGKDLLTAVGSGAKVGEQVGEALKIATTVTLTAEMVAEVWEAIGQLSTAQSLFRRAGGTWVQIEDSSGFLL